MGCVVARDKKYRQEQPLPNTNSNELIPVVIRTVNNLQRQVNLDKNIAGGGLKKYIYQHLCQELRLQDMSVLYNGTVIGRNQRLADFKWAPGSKITITQSKLAISQSRISIAQINGIDPITQERGTYRMICGHSIGRDTMTDMVRSLISCKKSQIRCPHLKQDGDICNAIWDFKICRQIGRFTEKELREFEKGLSLNWVPQNCKKCPNSGCNQVIYMNGLTSNRVRCPRCNSYDFCYVCLSKWTSNNDQFCGSQTCNEMYTLLLKCPWNRVFPLTNRQDSSIKKNYFGPQYRACPRDNTVIEYASGCKHMRCPSCKKRFCWICLSLEETPGPWSCGGSYQYCGEIAPVQNLT